MRPGNSALCRGIGDVLWPTLFSRRFSSVSVSDFGRCRAIWSWRGNFAKRAGFAPNGEKEAAMDWDRVSGNWKQVKGKVKEKWGRLTDDDLNVINGQREQLEGKLQERYGYAKDQARKNVDAWFNTM